MIGTLALAISLLAAPPVVDDGASVLSAPELSRLEAQISGLVLKTGIDAQVATFRKTPTEGIIEGTLKEARLRGFGPRWIFIAYYEDTGSLRVASEGVPIQKQDLTYLMMQKVNPLLGRGQIGYASEVAAKEAFRLASRFRILVAIRGWAWSWLGWLGDFVLVFAGFLFVAVVGVFLLMGKSNDYDDAARKPGYEGEKIARKGKALFVAEQILRKKPPKP